MLAISNFLDDKNGNCKLEKINLVTDGVNNVIFGGRGGGYTGRGFYLIII